VAIKAELEPCLQRKATRDSPSTFRPSAVYKHLKNH
jgi:hypothetical protein